MNPKSTYNFRIYRLSGHLPQFSYFFSPLIFQHPFNLVMSCQKLNNILSIYRWVHHKVKKWKQQKTRLRFHWTNCYQKRIILFCSFSSLVHCVHCIVWSSYIKVLQIKSYRGLFLWNRIKICTGWGWLGSLEYMNVFYSYIHIW